ncbi:hypothetical protein SH661x_003567 [Planctomicrobium sp. SH661]|uniref:hypothetical protein n=1 Tax=Planctomicrobium sp. SH661 TaxID=3448124 RepID=UPI003F5CB6B7
MASPAARDASDHSTPHPSPSPRWSDHEAVTAIVEGNRNPVRFELFRGTIALHDQTPQCQLELKQRQVLAMLQVVLSAPSWRNSPLVV